MERIERGEVAPGTKHLRVHLPEPLYVRLTMVAKLNRRTPGYYVTRAIQREIREHEKTHGPIVLPPLPTGLMRPLSEKARPRPRLLQVTLPESVYAELRLLALLSRKPMTVVTTVAIRHLLHDHADAKMWPKEYLELSESTPKPMRSSTPVFFPTRDTDSTRTGTP